MIGATLAALKAATAVSKVDFVVFKSAAVASDLLLAFVAAVIAAARVALEPTIVLPAAGPSTKATSS